MKMKKQLRRLGLGLALAALLLCLGCGGEQSNRQERVSVAFWSDTLMEHYAAYLQETFPEVDFEFYVGVNSTDFYRFKEAHGDLPDIMTVRRFSLNDVAGWRDSLLDLSDTELANTFHQAYLRSYTYSDGRVNWLPACAEIDGLIINAPLLAANELALPTNYQEFVEVCSKLREQGIRPVLSNFEADYTCMEFLQGLSIPQLTSQAGREWRLLYESGQTDQLSRAVWLPVFERMEEFIAYAGFSEADLQLGSTDVTEAFLSGQAAMVRGTGNERIIRGSVGGEALLLPYFGATAEENWYLTYPTFQVAASARAEESPERKQLILAILAAMLNQEGEEQIATGQSQNMIPYNKDVTLELSEELVNLQPYIDSNRLYIRLASSDMFAISKQVVQGMITGEYPDAEAAFAAFNEAMAAEPEPPAVAARLDKSYDYEFAAEGGSPAVSALLNSLREELGCQLALGQSILAAGNIAAGDYSLAELNYLILGESAFKPLVCEMTGEQLYEFISRLLAAKDTRGAVINDSTLYAASGFELQVNKTAAGYQLAGLAIDGKALERSQTYQVAVLVNEATLQEELLAACGVTGELYGSSCKEIIVERLAAGGQLAEPTPYITLK